MAYVQATMLLSRLVGASALEHIQKALLEHPGIERVDGNADTNRLTVHYRSEIITAMQVEHAVTTLGIHVMEKAIHVEQV